MTRKHYKYVEGEYRGEHDYWLDCDGNQYRHRTGDGVSGNPYVYYWQDDANCRQYVIEALLKTDLLRTQVVIDKFHRITVESWEDAYRAALSSTPFTAGRAVRKVVITFDRWSSRIFARAVADGGKWGNECHFSTKAGIDDFVQSIEDEFLRQKMLKPAEKGT